MVFDRQMKHLFTFSGRQLPTKRHVNKYFTLDVVDYSNSWGRHYAAPTATGALLLAGLRKAASGIAFAKSFLTKERLGTLTAKSRLILRC